MKHLTSFSICALLLFQTSQCMLQKHSYSQRRIPSKTGYSAITTTNNQKHRDRYLCEFRENKLRASLYKFAESKIQEIIQSEIIQEALVSRQKMSLSESKGVKQKKDKMGAQLTPTQFASSCSKGQLLISIWLLPADILKNIITCICDHHCELFEHFNQKPIGTLLRLSLMQNKLNDNQELAKIFSALQLYFVPDPTITTLFELTEHVAHNPKEPFELNLQTIDDLCKLDCALFSDEYFKNKRIDIGGQDVSSCSYGQDYLTLKKFIKYFKNPTTEKPADPTCVFPFVVSSELSRPTSFLGSSICISNISYEKNKKIKPIQGILDRPAAQKAVNFCIFFLTSSASALSVSFLLTKK